MRIDDVRVGETYALKLSGQLVAANVTQITTVRKRTYSIWTSGPRPKSIRNYRQPRVQYTSPWTNEQIESIVQARDLVGPWTDYAEAVERDRAAEADAEDALEKLHSALGEVWGIHTTGKHLIRVILTPDHARAIADRMEEGST